MAARAEPTSSLGRWLSADWSAVPVPVPYANLTNPQTLNLYAMVSDNPETFADLDGHDGEKDGGTNRRKATDQIGGSGENLNEATPQKPPPPPSPQKQSTVTIAYAPGVPKMSRQMETYVRDVASAAGVDSVRISATTNGEHAPNSWHYGGQAVDIDRVNGRAVHDAGSNEKVLAAVESVQHAANNQSIGTARENYGPAGLYRSGVQLDGKEGPHVALQAQHDNHIHLTVHDPVRRPNAESP